MPVSNDHENRTFAQHASATPDQHAHATAAQHASSTGAQHAAWMMDQDGPLEDAFLDIPIPYRLSHEAGRALDEIDARGMVP